MRRRHAGLSSGTAGGLNTSYTDWPHGPIFLIWEGLRQRSLVLQAGSRSDRRCERGAYHEARLQAWISSRDGSGVSATSGLGTGRQEGENKDAESQAVEFDQDPQWAAVATPRDLPLELWIRNHDPTPRSRWLGWNAFSKCLSESCWLVPFSLTRRPCAFVSLACSARPRSRRASPAR